MGADARISRVAEQRMRKPRIVGYPDRLTHLVDASGQRLCEHPDALAVDLAIPAGGHVAKCPACEMALMNARG